MKIGDLTELATQNLREAILRNSLTTLGIAVGVASLVAMLSLGVGLQQMIDRRLERNGLFDTVLVRPRTTFNATGQIRRNRDFGPRSIARPQQRPVARARARMLAIKATPPAISAISFRTRSIKTRAANSRNSPTSSRSIPNFASPAICASARPAI